MAVTRPDPYHSREREDFDKVSWELLPAWPDPSGSDLLHPFPSKGPRRVHCTYPPPSGVMPCFTFILLGSEGVVGLESGLGKESD